MVKKSNIRQFFAFTAVCLITLEVNQRVIARKSLYIEEFKDYFAGSKQISSKAIHEFYQKLEDEIKPSTMRWRIYELKNKGIIHHLKRGVYSLSSPQKYKPELSNNLISTYNTIQNHFPYLNFSLWTTKWLNEFMEFQPGRFYHLIETEIEGMDAVFEHLKDEKYDVYLNPTEEILNRYAVQSKQTWIVKKLVTESPLQKIHDIPTPTLEKILVDIYSDEEIFAAFQGNTLPHIFRNAIQRYVIDESKLLRYASRKGKKSDIRKFIESLPLDQDTT